MENFDYIGAINAIYINVSKNNKEYSTGYVNLPDENGQLISYKFLIFKATEVQKIKEFTPEQLKGKTVTLNGNFQLNNYQGNSEYQLMVNTITLPEDLMENVTASTPSQEVTPEIIPIPDIELPGMPSIPDA